MNKHMLPYLVDVGKKRFVDRKMLVLAKKWLQHRGFF